MLFAMVLALAWGQSECVVASQADRYSASCVIFSLASPAANRRACSTSTNCWEVGRPAKPDRPETRDVLSSAAAGISGTTAGAVTRGATLGSAAYTRTPRSVIPPGSRTEPAGGGGEL